MRDKGSIKIKAIKQPIKHLDSYTLKESDLKAYFLLFTIITAFLGLFLDVNVLIER